MNGSASPDPPTTEAGDSGKDEIQVGTVNGHRSPNADDGASNVPKSSPPRSKPDASTETASANEPKTQEPRKSGNGDDDGADSEAETLIDSPVKKKEAEKQKSNAIKPERAPKHRIGSLPVPTDGDDENDSAAVSPAPSTVMSVEKAVSTEDVKDEDMDRQDGDSDKENDDSDSLSSPGSHGSDAPSRGSSLSRAVSERPEYSRTGPDSPNPRKRKHRASSVGAPTSNKRPSIDAPKRRLRGLHSEEVAGRNELSPSPKLRSHRRAVSTQSAFADGGVDGPNRKRRAGVHGSGKEYKMSKAGWEESDASSETTSHGHSDYRRPQRGIGRSTSTPGRPPGREHKRHVNKYGFTKLAEACEEGDLDLVRQWREKDPDQVELAEFAGNKPLQIAALNGNVEVVDYLIQEGCQIDCANVDKDTPLIDAAENGHLDVVNSLLRAGVDPLRQNLKGQQALDVVTDDTDDADAIRGALRKAIEDWNSTGAKQKREEEEEQRHRAGPSKELHFMARSYENLLKLVQNNDRNGVREFLDARVPVDNAIIAAAAKTGDSYLVNMLLVELPEKKRGQKPERPLLSVLGTSHFEMVKSLTELDNFNPLYQNRQGKTWPEIAEERHGPNWKQETELLQHLYDRHLATLDRRSSSPVTKRDSVKRRLISRAAEEESEEEEAPRRKNGRKLMSMKELRAARTKASSDESSDESNSEMATGLETAEPSMKPPDSPVTKRTPTRSRTKSFSAQPTDSSPRTRRRSSSLRGASEQPLPTLEESAEDKEAPLKQREAEKKRAEEEAEEARKLAAQREAEVKAEEEAAAKRAAEEAERKAEEERRAEEARRKEAEMRAAEARRVEEERQRKDAELAEARRLHREQIIAAVPHPVSYVLDPSSDFDYGNELALPYLIHHFTPLQVLRHELSLSSADWTHWIVNVQAAPLLGKRGIELMLRDDINGYEGSLADIWETKDVYTHESPLIESVLMNLPQDLPSGPIPVDENGQSTLSFDRELETHAAGIRTTFEAKERLRGSDCVLRYVRLDDVLKNLHPTLRQASIDVQFDHLPVMKRALPPMKDQTDFVGALAAFNEVRQLPKSFVDGQQIDPDSFDGNGVTSGSGMTIVNVRHAK